MKKLLLLTGMLLFAVVASFAQMKKGDPDAQEVIEKYLKAIGGKEKLGKAKTWVIKGTMESEDFKAKVTYLIKYDKVRIEIELAGQKFIQAYDGVDAWDQSPFEGKGSPRYSVEESLDASSILMLVYPIYLIGKYRDQVLYNGIKTLNDKKVHHLYLENDYKTDYFFDAQTYLLIERNSSNGASTKFSKYLIDEYSKMKIPQFVEVKSSNTIALNDISVGVDLSDSLFAFPENSETTLFNKYSRFIVKGDILATEKGVTAEEVVQKYTEVNRKLSALKSMQVEGKFYFNKSEKGFPVKGYYVNEKRNRLEMNMMGKKLVMVSNGDLKWEINPFKSNTPEILEGKSDNTSLKLADADLMDYKARGHKITYISREYVGKILCHKIELLKKSGEVIYFFLGVNDHNLYKESFKNDEDGASFFLNFKKINGVLVPHIFYMINEDDKQHIIVEIDKFIFNQPIDDKIFEFPGNKRDSQKKDKKD
ncbi:hypothetical protein BKI52_02430 [marine bacterium AO1-C]|nr:hypothetical protein BKI52_02430 [marine bacterium AO1-C]